MSHRSTRWVGALAVALLVLGALPALADLEKRFRIAPPTVSENFGQYRGETCFALGRVLSTDFTESSSWLGVSPQRGVPLSLEVPREQLIRDALQKLLEDTGLAARSADEADFVVDVTIRRHRVHTDREPEKGRVRAQADVFLEFVFRSPQSVAHRVLARGHTETIFPHKMGVNPRRDRMARAYGEALKQSMRSLVASNTFLDLVGEDWTAATPPPAPLHVTRIDPTPPPAAHGYRIEEGLTRLEKLLASRPTTTLVLQDLKIGDGSFLKEEQAGKKAKKWAKRLMVPGWGWKKTDKEALGEERDRRAALAARLLPDLLREHLEAYHPGAFETIERRGSWEETDGLVIDGEILEIAMGMMRNGIVADLHVKDGKTAETLFTIHIDAFPGAGTVMNPGTGGAVPEVLKAARNNKMLAKLSETDAVWIERDPARDMRDKEDELANELARLLVEALRPDHRIPETLEVS